MASTASKNIVSNAWSSANEEDAFDVEDPATGAVLARVQGSGPDEVGAAVRRAHDAFLTWRELTGRERGQYLFGAADSLGAHTDELAELLSAENGKPVRDAKELDLQMLVGSFRFFGGLADKLPGSFLTQGSVNVGTVREPFGVVAGIIPFNWPPIHLGGKVAPALAAGNTVVLKPGEQAPLTILRIVEILNEVLPAGVVSAVAGGAAVGIALTAHPLVRMISFTGSPESGTAVLKAAAERHVPVLTELGGKNPFIVFDDADLDRAVYDAVEGAFFNKGEACTAASRILVQDGVHEEFVRRFADAVSKLRVGDGRDDGTHVGPLVSRQQQAKVAEYINVGVGEGATITAQAALPDDEDLRDGFFVQPTVFTGVEPGMRIAQEEIFGPVTCVMRFSTEDEAVEIANGTRYALVSAVYTRNSDVATRVARRVEAGVAFINNYFRAFLGSPFGGTKASGSGREHSADTLLEFTYAKALRAPSGEGVVPRWGAISEIFD
ncbi:aldehyde dehydrogenase family protein [Georgenia ruanii]|uniref:Aldehyde dehydrogenase family protein n=1 Tax=Georgenia ruanii TaxID=348442 RepID=A0A7J9UXG5_9MICO|nr:aldehyde dehydrogenase family protein [Georgenia ruanii]MPV89319.1 aldehyde dehydrogenase family protein [Georgenia ruanii]